MVFVSSASYTGSNKKHLIDLIEQFINIFVVNIKQHIINDRSRARHLLHSIWTQAYFSRYDIVPKQ